MKTYKKFLFVLFGFLFLGCNDDIISKIIEVPQEEPERFSISIIEHSLGSVCFQPEKEFYEKNETVVIIAVPNSGAKFISWKGFRETSDNPLVVKMTEDITLVPLFAEKEPEPEAEKFSISIIEHQLGSVCFQPEKEFYEKNETVVIIAVPNSGAKFISWKGFRETSDNPLVVKMTEDITLVPLFAEREADPVAERFSISVIEHQLGSLCFQPFKESYEKNETVMIRAVPNSGAKFLSWKGFRETSDNPLVVKMTEDITLVPLFAEREVEPEAEKFSISIIDHSLGSVCFQPEKEFYEKNETVVIIAIPNSGAKFISWKGFRETSDNPLVVKMTEDITLVPLFAEKEPEPEAEKFSISIIEHQLGSLCFQPEKEFYEKNETVVIIAVPNSGAKFISWKGFRETSDNPLVVKMTEDITLVPLFAEKEAEPFYTLLLNQDPGGKIIKSSDNDHFAPGEKCNLEAVALDGYSFTGWAGDIESKDPRIFITFTNDIQVYASFQKTPTEILYSLTTTESTGGSLRIIPSKTSFYKDELVNLHAMPDSGYMFHEWIGDIEADQKNSAEITIQMTKDKNLKATFIKRNWTTLIYMAADNDLEIAAIQDMNELEAVNFSGTGHSVLVLLDRAFAYDATNGDWTDTRLFEIQYDKGGINGTIISKRIECPLLDLYLDRETELNMADPNTLHSLLSFTKNAYSSDNLALIIWGHGTGWRNNNTSPEGISPMKAVAIDEYSNAYMSLPQLKTALDGFDIDIIGFDTCFGALIECAYELKNNTRWFVASEGAIPASGWDYEKLFTHFFTTNKSAESFADSMINQFASQYSGIEKATISKIKMENIAEVKTALDNFGLELAKTITNTTSQQATRDILFNAIESYSYTQYPCDLFLDIFSLASYYKTSTNTKLKNFANSLEAAITKSVTNSWSASGSTNRKLGVHLIPLEGWNLTLSTHEDAYVKGSGAPWQTSFVKESTGWVPTKTTVGSSLLDKLFYCTF